MDMEIKNAVSASDTDAQYDEKAKRLLGNKMILAYILVKADERGTRKLPYLKQGGFLCQPSDLVAEGKGFCQDEL